MEPVKAEEFMKKSSVVSFLEVIKASLIVVLFVTMHSTCPSCQESLKAVQSKAEKSLPRPFSLDFSNNSYRDKRQNYPKSIQDVLKENSSNNMERIGKSNNTLNLEKLELLKFKPNDPGDVNLLASTSFRFSPMVGRIHKEQKRNGRHEENKLNIVEMIKQKRPFVMTLSVIPVEHEKEVEFFDNMWKMKMEKH